DTKLARYDRGIYVGVARKWVKAAGRVNKRSQVRPPIVQSRNAVSGLVALAISCCAARPDSNAARPASTAILKATAMRFGSLATAMAVLIRTASAPSSIASAA